jgi:hypothetical protein
MVRKDDQRAWNLKARRDLRLLKVRKEATNMNA